METNQGRKLFSLLIGSFIWQPWNKD